jgi:hypothetical protein
LCQHISDICLCPSIENNCNLLIVISVLYLLWFGPQHTPYFCDFIYCALCQYKSYKLSSSLLQFFLSCACQATASLDMDRWQALSFPSHRHTLSVSLCLCVLGAASQRIGRAISSLTLVIILCKIFAHDIFYTVFWSVLLLISGASYHESFMRCSIQ